MRKTPAWTLSVIVLLCAPMLSFGRATRNPQLDTLADLVAAWDLHPLYDAVTTTEWTHTVLDKLSSVDRMRLAKAIRTAKRWTIRQSTLEQYRIPWRSSKRSDSEAIISFPMDTHPGEVPMKPQIAFSSKVDRIPGLLADALEENRIPLALSYYLPGSSWRESIPKMNPTERKKLAHSYRTMKLQDAQEEDRAYIGQFADRFGVIRQNTLKLHLDMSGRWLAE